MSNESFFDKYFVPTEHTTPEDAANIKETVDVLESVNVKSSNMTLPEGVDIQHIYTIDLTPSFTKHLMVLNDGTVIYIELRDEKIFVRSNKSSDYLNNRYFQ